MAKENCSGGSNCIEVMKVAAIEKNKQNLIDLMDLSPEQVGMMIESAVFYSPCPQCEHLKNLVRDNYIPHVYRNPRPLEEPVSQEAKPKHE